MLVFITFHHRNLISRHPIHNSHRIKINGKGHCCMVRIEFWSYVARSARNSQIAIGTSHDTTAPVFHADRTKVGEFDLSNCNWQPQQLIFVGLKVSWITKQFEFGTGPRCALRLRKWSLITVVAKSNIGGQKLLSWGVFNVESVWPHPANPAKYSRAWRPGATLLAVDANIPAPRTSYKTKNCEHELNTKGFSIEWWLVAAVACARHSWCVVASLSWENDRCAYT